MWPYESESEAVRDVLRLSRAMTYKAAAADLPMGGGKGVIMGDPRTLKTEALLRSYGMFVDTLGGRYLTTTDVGTTTRDLEDIRLETRPRGGPAPGCRGQRGHLRYDRPGSLHGHEGVRL